MDRRSNGWVGQGTWEFATPKGGREKARSIGEAVESRGADFESAIMVTVPLSIARTKLLC